MKLEALSSRCLGQSSKIVTVNTTVSIPFHERWEHEEERRERKRAQAQAYLFDKLDGFNWFLKLLRGN